MHAFWRRLRRWLREPRVLSRVETEALQITIEVRTWLPFPVFAAVLAWYIAAPAPVAMMSAITLGGILLVSYVWARAMAGGVRGHRKLHFAAMQVGDELEEQLELRNDSRLPVLWAEFKDRSNIPGYTVASARAADPLSKVAWRAQTVCTRRGVYNLGPWELRIGEPFGIFLINQVYLQHQEILVYPPLAELPQHILSHRGALGDRLPINQPLRAETISSTSVRPYQPGDPLRQIHWRTTARRSNPFVKVFAPEAASNVWLVPDFDSASHLGDGQDSSEEMMVTVVASLAADLLHHNLAVGMFARADTDAVVLPRQGQLHLWTLLQVLAPLRAAPGKHLGEVLDGARSLVSGNDLMIVVTPSMHMDWITSLRRVSRSRGGIGRAEVILLDPASFGGHEHAEKNLPAILELGIPATYLRREDVQLISGYYGEVSRWEFSVLGTGRVVTRKKPRLAGPLLEPAQPSWKQRRE